MSALRALIAPLSRGRFFAEVRVSGAHSASLAMVARGESDVAAIDCVVHALLARHRPAALHGVATRRLNGLARMNDRYGNDAGAAALAATRRVI